MHRYLHISKQQASSSGGRHQFGYQVSTPYQIKANIFDSNIHHHGSDSAAARAIRQWMVDYKLTSVPDFKSGNTHTYEKGVFSLQQNKVIHRIVVIDWSLSDTRKMCYGGKKQVASKY